MKLLVGYDGSDPAREAAHTAAHLARRLGASVVIFTVGKIPAWVEGVSGVFIPVIDESDFVPIATEGAQIVRAIGVEVDTRVAMGEPADRIIDLAGREEFDLVIVGHRGLGGVRGLVLGSIAKRVAEAAPCPVLVVRGPAPDTIERILVGIDGSQHSLKALSAAIELAKPFEAKITLIYVLDSTVIAAVRSGPAMRELRLSMANAGLEALREASQRCQQAGVNCDTVQTEGRPASVISRRAKEGDYDLVAIGRRGISGLARFALGGVSDAVLRSVNRPVLVAGEQAK
ncbi:MAG: universal stress protein [Chloroflexota bacterium]|jgi:nucleotide-binding universal stress UspA family protein